MSLIMNLTSTHVLRVTDIYLPISFFSFFSPYLRYLRACVCSTLSHFKKRYITWPLGHTTSVFPENPGYHNSAGIPQMVLEMIRIMPLLIQLTELLFFNMYIKFALTKDNSTRNDLQNIKIFYLGFTLRLQIQKRLSGVQVFWWVFSAAIVMWV